MKLVTYPASETVIRMDAKKDGTLEVTAERAYDSEPKVLFTLKEDSGMKIVLPLKSEVKVVREREPKEEEI